MQTRPFKISKNIYSLCEATNWSFSPVYARVYKYCSLLTQKFSFFTRNEAMHSWMLNNIKASFYTLLTTKFLRKLRNLIPICTWDNPHKKALFMLLRQSWANTTLNVSPSVTLRRKDCIYYHFLSHCVGMVRKCYQNHGHLNSHCPWSVVSFELVIWWRGFLNSAVLISGARVEPPRAIDTSRQMNN